MPLVGRDKEREEGWTQDEQRGERESTRIKKVQARSLSLSLSRCYKYFMNGFCERVRNAYMYAYTEDIDMNIK